MPVQVKLFADYSVAITRIAQP